MGNDDLLSGEVSTTYYRAYELASELACSRELPVARGHRTSLAEHWVLDAILAKVLQRLDGGGRDDPALILMAVRDVLGNRRSAIARLTNAGSR
jgi:hypothetical protein